MFARLAGSRRTVLAASASVLSQFALPPVPASATFAGASLFEPTSSPAITAQPKVDVQPEGAPTPQGAPTIRDLTKQYLRDHEADPAQQANRAWWFGAQGNGDVFATTTDHSNALVPVYEFGAKIDLGEFSGDRSLYRDPARVAELYQGNLPGNTVNPRATYMDHTQIPAAIELAVARGAKHIVVLILDGISWDATRAAAYHRTGQLYREGRGEGLSFQDFNAEVDGKPTTSYALSVTAPLRGKDGSSGGYDPVAGGENPWNPLTNGQLLYLQGGPALFARNGMPFGRDFTVPGREGASFVQHPFTDSAASATAFSSGRKTDYGTLNMSRKDHGTRVETIFELLQRQGFSTGAVTDMAVTDATPAGSCAHVGNRTEFGAIALQEFGLEDPERWSGLDVIIGAGLDFKDKNAPNGYITGEFLDKVRAAGHYEIVTPERDQVGDELVQNGGERVRANREAGHEPRKFAAIFNGLHFPLRGADGDFGLPPKDDPSYANTLAKIREQATLAPAVTTALNILNAGPNKRFILQVEAGSGDRALHALNMDGAIGDVYDGDAAFTAIVQWVQVNSNWVDTTVLVTSDHGQNCNFDYSRVPGPTSIPKN